MTIGSHATATMLFNHFKGGETLGLSRSPKGFNLLGSGCYRTAILEKSTKVVYKIGYYGANVSEAANARMLARRSTRSLDFELRIPQTRTYRMTDGRTRRAYRTNRRCVVAQEWAGKAMFTDCQASNTWMQVTPKCNCHQYSSICWAKVLRDVAEWSGLSDIHSGNVLMDKKGVFWLIDLAT